jgi:hypothetical protein
MLGAAINFTKGADLFPNGRTACHAIRGTRTIGVAKGNALMLRRSIVSIALMSFFAGYGNASIAPVSVGATHSTDQFGLPSHGRGWTACHDAVASTALKCCGENEIGCRISRRGVNKNELWPIYNGDPVPAYSSPVLSEKSASFGTLRLEKNEIRIEPSPPPGTSPWNSIRDTYHFDQRKP